MTQIHGWTERSMDLSRDTHGQPHTTQCTSSREIIVSIQLEI